MTQCDSLSQRHVMGSPRDAVVELPILTALIPTIEGSIRLSGQVTVPIDGPIEPPASATDILWPPLKVQVKLPVAVQDMTPILVGMLVHVSLAERPVRCAASTRVAHVDHFYVRNVTEELVVSA